MNELRGTLIILSGLPGGGKSTLARKLANEDMSIICSADDYFVTRSGEYIFDVNKIGAAHKVCQAKVRSLMAFDEPSIIVDNTNTTIKEMATYVEMASEANYEVKLIRVVHDTVEKCAERTIHNVPLETIQKMSNRLVDIDDAQDHFIAKYPTLRVSAEIRHFIN